MKRVVAYVLVFSLLLSVTLSLTGCAEKATDFSDSTIDNGYYNYMAGGNMASVDGYLYLNLIADVLYMGTFKVSSDKNDLLLDDHINFDIFEDAPSIYQLGDDLYFTDPDYTEFYKFYMFDKKTDSLSDEALDFNLGLGVCYMSEELDVCMSNDREHLLVKYKDNDEIALDETVSAFDVYDNKIYFINHDGWLFVNDPSKLETESEFLSELNYNGVLTKMVVCNGHCYFTDSGSDASSGEDGLYRYSLENDTIELVLQEEVLSMNVQGDKVYFATEKGVYVDDSKNCEKFSNKKAHEIYVFDDEWVYLYNTEKGRVIRISSDGSVTQKIG